MNNRAIGNIGEEAACRLLEEKGYVIRERNYRCRRGEIDIIACRENRICFVEVKTRQSGRFGSPCEAVDGEKKKRMLLTAKCYIKELESRGEIFDSRFEFQVVEIMARHIENAF